jgi:1-acyl-sn-glycerol-3-phosphate acyltransferase
MRPFHNSAFHIASRAGVRVLPVTVSGAFEMMPRHSNVVLRGGEIQVTIHPAMGPLEQTHDAAVAASTACQQLIEAALPRSASDAPLQVPG